jgi:uncharacterized Ntn-hydrolase superfamily protein
MEKVAEILGVKLGEKFKINGEVYWLDKDGMIDDTGHRPFSTLGRLVIGQYTIEKLPWKPQESDRYWVVLKDRHAVRYFWDDDCVDYSLYYAGNCFATREEALAHAPEVIEKLRRKYEEG